MKHQPTLLIVISFIIPTNSVADGLSGLAGMEGLYNFYIFMATTAAIFIAWLIISIKYIISKNHYKNKLKNIIYAALSTLIIAMSIFIIPITRSPYNYIFVIGISIVVTVTTYSLLKSRNFKKEN